MFSVVDSGVFIPSSFYERAVLRKGRTALILSKLEFEAQITLSQENVHALSTR